MFANDINRVRLGRWKSCNLNGATTTRHPNQGALWAAVGFSLLVIGCQRSFGDGPPMNKSQGNQTDRLALGVHVPETGEIETVGAIQSGVLRGSPEFAALVRAIDANFVVKDEEGSGADRMMTPRLLSRLLRLTNLVRKEWPGIRLRVSEAWDERHEHGLRSLHYEGRAADLTTSDRDGAKLGRLARLAVDANLDWVYYEDRSHVHVSVKR